MGKVNVSDVQIAIAQEASFGGNPANNAVAYILQPNEIPNFGGTITTVARQPLGSRQARKGTTTDFEAAAEINSDLTVGSAGIMAPYFLLNPKWSGLPVEQKYTAKPSDGLTISGAVAFPLPEGVDAIINGMA